jgi:glycosyltransferase involved in cell wall biosynthesis
MTFQASIVISFYKKIEWLKLVLAALERQSCSNFEVVIADDGSPDDIVQQVREIQQQSPMPIRHIWHPDEGFTKTIILNKAVIASTAPYLIFIDGDCLPHKNFISDHLRLQQVNSVLAGRRVYLSEKLSNTITIESIRDGILEKGFLWRLFLDKFRGDTRHPEKGIHLNSNFINRKLGSEKGLLGCNFSVSKELVLSVNGFDERYKYPGVGEDSEIEYRWLKMGVKIFAPRFALVQYHLWHPLLSRENKSNNMLLYEETQNKGYVYTPYGINKM